MSSPSVTRLHISPLTPDLLPAVLGSRLVAIAQNVSYHQLQTFPENNYGYVDLPIKEAVAVKKKLHGAILRGQKMKIEEARQKKRKHLDDEPVEGTAGDGSPQSGKKSKKARKEKNVITGREVSPDRKIKRGWTEPEQAGRKEKKEKKSKKDPAASDRIPSKHTDKEELLFRTRVPENRLEAVTKTKDKKDKKAKGKTSEVVHEFDKHEAQPAFLRSAHAGQDNKKVAYVDGKGWVDEADNIVEPEPRNLRERRKAKLDKSAEPPKTIAIQTKGGTADTAEATVDQKKAGEDETSSEGSSPSTLPDPQTPSDGAKVGSSSQHPLEALFKKPQKPASSQDVAKPSLEISTGFAFFGGADDDDLEEEPDIPATPYTSQDVRSRGLRSAAPTPDTAHPSRFNSYSSAGKPGDDDASSDEHDTPRSLAGLGLVEEGSSLHESEVDAPQSDFVKQFWEKRGENNRAWKARRRTVLKEQRQRENRARRPKNW
jgi:hypothetical protein